jgi:hypothetical protein
VPSPLVDAHLTAQERLRVIVADAVAEAWNQLPGYNEADTEAFVARAVPLVLGGQRAAAQLTDGYVASAMDRAALGLDMESVIGAAARNGTPLEEVYRRPFVTVWTALKNGRPYEDAVASGLARVREAAVMDVQLAHRASLQAIQDGDPSIRGFRRVANGAACQFCLSIDGAIVSSASAMALHTGCGCGLEPLTGGSVRASATPDAVAVHEHGELGPVLTDPSHDFTGPQDLRPGVAPAAVAAEVVAPPALRSSLEDGAAAVLRPHGVKLDRLVVESTSKRGHRAEGGLIDGKLTIKVSPTIGKTPQAARSRAQKDHATFTRRRAEELEKLEKRAASSRGMARVAGPRIEELRATERFSVDTVAADPVRAVVAHEAAHVLQSHYGRDVFNRIWSEESSAIDRLDRRRVSEYAATNDSELWAEITAALDAGLSVPSAVREAYERTMRRLRALPRT